MSVKKIACTNCNSTIFIKAVGLSISAVCQNCKFILDITTSEYKIIDIINKKIKRANLILEIGDRGNIDNIEWEVIGYQLKSDQSKIYFWSEYLLYNPYYGYRFLVENSTHWTFFKKINVLPNRNFSNSSYSYRGNDYKFVSSTTSITHDILGEFYWRVKIDDFSYVADYLFTPNLLSLERNDDEINWSYGVYIESEVIKEKFNKKIFPKTIGVGVNQPNLYKNKLKKTLAINSIFIALVFILQIFFMVLNKNQKILDFSYSFSPNVQYSLGEIEIKKSLGSLEALVYVPDLSNNWSEFEFVFSSPSSKENLYLVNSAEFYSGIDSDGSWSEGSKRGTASLNMPAAGNYNLFVTVFSDRQKVDANIRLYSGVVKFSNFLLCFLLLLLNPIYLIYRYNNFESKRAEHFDEEV